MLHGSADSPAVEMRRKAGPVLGLHNTLEFYPFMKLKTLQEKWAALLKIIPQKQEVLRYFPSHGAAIYPLHPALMDPDDLESAFCEYLSALEAGELRSPDEGYLADPAVRSVQRAFDALRLANYVLHPSLDVVQTLLIIGNVLQDVGQSDGAWVMLGTTIRLAQALGLHTQKPLGFSEMMCGIVSACTGLLELEQPNCEASMKLLAELDGYQSRAVSYLQSRDNCTNIQQRYENLTIQIQLCFAISALCRPALTRSAITENEAIEARQIVKSRAKESLMSTAKAFIEFQALSIIPIRTWSLIHAVLSATILLCMWEETRCDQESRDVLQRVMEIFSRAAQADDETGMMVDPSGNNHWLSMNHTRALVALQNAIYKATPLDARAPSSPERQQVTEALQQQTYSLPRVHDANSLDPVMESMMSYDFTAMLGDGIPMDGYMYPWETSGLSPLVYLDSIMKAPYEAGNKF
ncbi:hypothetical protein TARUN_8465 [Trichoderma arundinaceum]|uniref:Xylanolytic transcriptional activator regulatory domain-containing protein n=1 Tax=Trichoderma arundinaceum TaxID=490622 RepID=A0A395ND35_TRIAR|nr:hypothetical protein TARUN_8465 [Trichoderma arundinaceum]